jgi:hypothetical protein
MAGRGEDPRIVAQATQPIPQTVVPPLPQNTLYPNPKTSKTGAGSIVRESKNCTNAK